MESFLRKIALQCLSTTRGRHADVKSDLSLSLLFLLPTFVIECCAIKKEYSDILDIESFWSNSFLYLSFYLFSYSALCTHITIHSVPSIQIKTMTAFICDFFQVIVNPMGFLSLVKIYTQTFQYYYLYKFNYKPKFNSPDLILIKPYLLIWKIFGTRVFGVRLV